MRYLFEISYLGTNYHGWQIQDNALSVQQVINEKLHLLLKEDIRTTGSGRTDTGVHALKQYFHMDIEKPIDLKDFMFHLNAVLPDDIAIHSIRPVRDDVSARFDAVSRSYVYKILRTKNPFMKNMAYRYNVPINMEEMEKATRLLFGKQDFQSFSKVKTNVNNFICEIFDARWKQEDDILYFYIKANRFLRGMVRSIVGTLLMAGEGKIAPEDVRNVINRKDRKAAGRAVPACGLYLSEIQYPENIFI